MLIYCVIKKICICLNNILFDKLQLNDQSGNLHVLHSALVLIPELQITCLESLQYLICLNINIILSSFYPKKLY